MTAYHGGKQKIGKEIAETLFLVNKVYEKNDFVLKGYCEPFIGMAGVYQHIPQLFNEYKIKYKAGDINKSLIMMWTSLQKGWKPPKSCSKKRYEELKYNNKNTAEKGFIGHLYGYGGQYFIGYRNNSEVSFSHEKSRNKVIEISKKLNKVEFSCENYLQYSQLKGFIIYCDPPYEGYTRYYSELGKRVVIDHEKFWDWARKMSKNNIVVISEYKAPKDFHCFKKIGKGKTNAGKESKGNEKLFIFS